MPLLEFTKNGIYCRAADVYIDPWRPVKNALITHGHADHSRWGHKAYLSTDKAAPVIRYRLGNVNLSTLKFGENISINGVKFSFHPAGHIIGSAQIRVEHKGEVWVVSGDYKLEDDGLALPFEPVKCHTFITECTFGLPVYKWEPQEQVFESINAWWRQNQAEGKTSLLTAYSLGKAQRVIRYLDSAIGPVFTHGAVENTNDIIRSQGYDLLQTTKAEKVKKRTEYQGAMVIAPPSVLSSPWIKRFGNLSIGVASGWMALRGARRRRSVDRGFVLSDHADWEGLNTAVQETGAEKIFVTHGYTGIFGQWLTEQGYEVEEVKTEFEGEVLDSTQEDSKEA